MENKGGIMTVTIQLDVGELKELLNRKTVSMLEDYLAPSVTTRFCIKCQSEFTPREDNQHYCPACQGKKKNRLL